VPFESLVLCVYFVFPMDGGDNHTGYCFTLTALRFSCWSQTVSFYADCGWMVTLTSFRKPAGASRASQRPSRNLEDQIQPLYSSILGSVPRDMIFKINLSLVFLVK
jgi:hypothetical protein